MSRVTIGYNADSRLRRQPKTVGRAARTQRYEHNRH
jgi:hypothetical protein